MRKIVLFSPNLDIGHAKAIIMPVTVFHFPETTSIAQTKHTVYTPIAAILMHMIEASGNKASSWNGILFAIKVTY